MNFGAERRGKGGCRQEKAAFSDRVADAIDAVDNIGRYDADVGVSSVIKKQV